MKAIGARDRSITGVIMAEILVTALLGGVAGYFLGFGFAQLIGRSVFGSAITMKVKVIPIVAALLIKCLGVSPIYIIIVAALAGFVYGRYKHKQAKQDNQQLKD